MEHLNALFLTYCYPPQKSPRSIQISHLVQVLRDDFNISVITSEPEDLGDQSLLNFTPLDNVIYAQKSKITKWIERSKGHCIKRALLPDFQYLWHFDLFKKVRQLFTKSVPEVIFTFGHPMSTHLAGLKLKEIFPHLKWFAHFSDPWVDNIYNDYNLWTRCLNKHFQNKVFEHADRLLFTSMETIELVMKRYPNETREKSICIPHIFNKNLYKNTTSKKNEKFVIRYVGNFYGKRQPDNFLKALQNLSLSQRSKLRIEFIGSVSGALQDLIKSHDMENIVFLSGSVSYLESLHLMQTADLLLIIDALTDTSPFLPSKLIDYIGADRPIFGITPPGTSQKLIEEMDFLVASPENTAEISDRLMKMVQQVVKGEIRKIPVYIKSRYKATTVYEQMKFILS